MVSAKPVVRVLLSLVSLTKGMENGEEPRRQGGSRGIFGGEGAKMAGPVVCLLTGRRVVDDGVHDFSVVPSLTSPRKRAMLAAHFFSRSRRPCCSICGLIFSASIWKIQ